VRQPTRQNLPMGCTGPPTRRTLRDSPCRIIAVLRQQLSRRPGLRHLHIEQDGLAPSMPGFAAAMPALTEVEGMDEYPGNPRAPAEAEQLRAALPHVSVC
jgi:hypothetical protein